MSPGRHSGQQQQQARVASPSHFETQTDTQDRPQHRSLMNSLTHLWSNVETRFLAPATDPDAPGCLSPHHFSPDPEQEHPRTSPTARRRRRRAKGRSAKSPSAAWGPTHSSSSSSGSSHHSPSLNDQGGNSSHDGSVNHTVRSVGSADEQELFDTKMTTPVPPPRKQSSHHTADTTKASSSTSRSPRQPSPASGYSPPNPNDSSKLKVTLERIVESASKTFAILSPSDKDSPRSHNSNSNNNHVKKLSFQDNVISIMDDPCSPCRGEVMEEEQDWDRYQDDNEDDDDNVGIGIQPLQAPFPPGQAEYAQAHSASSARSVQTASISAAERRRQRHYDQKSSQQQHIINHQRRRRRQQKQRGGKEDDDDADARLEAKRISQQVAAIQKTSSQKKNVLVQPLNQKGKPLVGVDATTASSAFSLPFESVHLLESGMELDRSISELTMRSSYGEAMAPMTEHRRMAYYAVGKSTPTHTGVGGGGNRRCYFSGRSILGGAPFYAGSVQQGLRTLVVFLLPSALNLPEPHDLDRLLQKAQSSQSPPPTQSSKQSPKTSSLTQKNNLRSFRRSLNSRTSDPSLRTSGSTASGTHRSGASSPNTTYSSGTTTGTDDSMGGGGGGVLMEDYYYNYLQLDREALLDVLPEPDQGFLDRLKETFPAEFATLPIQVRSPHCWRLFCDFCFFSGLPIAEGELHYRVKDGIARPQFNKEEDAANHSHRTDPIILSHEVMEAVNGESTDILRLPNMKTFRYLQKHYTQQCSKLTEQVFERSSWELVRPEV